MKRVPLSYILKLATEFEHLAQDIDVQLPSAAKYFYSNLKRILNKDLSKKEFLTWLESNATVLGNKLSDTNDNWYVNYEKNLQQDLDLPGDNSKTIIVTTSPKLSSTWDDDEYVRRNVVESSVLRASGNIPAMKLFVIDSFSLSATSRLPKEVAHEEFLFAALSELFSRSTQEEIIEFYNVNKNKIDKIRNLFEGKPVQLGGGIQTADGVAFSIGQKLVLKIFTDRHSYTKAVEAYERLHKHPEIAKTEAMIYDIGVLGEFKGQNIYYYIMERMRTVKSLDAATKAAITSISKNIAVQIKDAKSLLTPIKSVIGDPSKYKEIKEKVRNLANKIAGVIDMNYGREIDAVENGRFTPTTESPRTLGGTPPELLNLKTNWLTLLAEELIMKYLTGRTDVHMGNLGITGYGEFRYFDPAYSGWTSKFNL
jgi:hypothetical protein